MAWKMRAEDGEELWTLTQKKIDQFNNGPQSNNIAVVTRVRPFNKREKDLNTYNCIEMKNEDPDNHQCWYVGPSVFDLTVSC